MSMEGTEKGPMEMDIEIEGDELMDMKNDKWSLIRVVFMHWSGVEQACIVRLLTEVFVRKGWFVTWTAGCGLVEEESKYIVLGGVKCDNVAEVEAVAGVLEGGLMGRSCFPLSVWWTEPSEDWREVLKDSPWGGLKADQVLEMKAWCGDERTWWRVWESFEIDVEKVDELLSGEDIVGNFMADMDVVTECDIEKLKLSDESGEEGEGDTSLELKKMCKDWWARLNGKRERVKDVELRLVF